MDESCDRVEALPEDAQSLARGLPDCPPGTLFVLGDRGGVRAGAGCRQIMFGRNEPDVDVFVGGGDPGISRRHGMLCRQSDGWTLRNIGALPIRFPGSWMLPPGREELLGAAYTPLFIRTGPDREHLVEVRVAAGPPPVPEPPDPAWTLSGRERLVLTALGERYLRHEAHPNPRSWAGTAALLRELQPDARWTPKRAEWAVANVRHRLVSSGINGLTREQVGEPVGNSLNHNLLLELLISTSLVPPDLRLLEG